MINNELLQFNKEIIHLLDKLQVKTLIYGSLAYSHYTGDYDFGVNDIDILVPKNRFSDIIGELDKINGLSLEAMPYESIEVHKGSLKIDIDSIECFLGDRSDEYEKSRIGDVWFNFINPDSLISIYEEALDNMPDDKKLWQKRRKYAEKISKLKAVNLF